MLLTRARLVQPCLDHRIVWAMAAAVSAVGFSYRHGGGDVIDATLIRPTTSTPSTRLRRFTTLLPPPSSCYRKTHLVISRLLSIGSFDTSAAMTVSDSSRSVLAPFCCRLPFKFIRLRQTMSVAVWTVLVALAISAFVSATQDDLKPCTVFVAILVRNKAHTLPYFFSALESLDYPKDRMHLW